MVRPTGFRSLRPSVDGNGEVLGEPGATVVGQPDRARARQPRDPFELEHPRSQGAGEVVDLLAPVHAVAATKRRIEVV
jgi:hypothetical protein